ncbi:M48 family metalloprotease [Natrinema salaciae]|uniref:hypothetical protein n=1 Tax=Natrinema salaciae TaxID=1186196 RepID=UPI001FE1BA8C|nr:hypothetical protein [Natrinema salaciae]
MLAYHVLFLAVLAGTTAFFTVLSVLNVRHGRRALERESDWVAERLDLEDTDRVVDYQRATTILSQGQPWVILALVLAVLYSGALATAVEWLEGLGYGPIETGAAFFVAAVVGIRLVSVPFDAYETFVIEERFDFNEASPGCSSRTSCSGRFSRRSSRPFSPPSSGSSFACRLTDRWRRPPCSRPFRSRCSCSTRG